MRIGDDLLAQARYLVHHEPRRPKQATLRRAISTAYYALFHLLTDAAAHVVISGEGLKDFRPSVERAHDHGTMKAACRAFAAGGLPDHLAALLPQGLSADLRLVASTFGVMQDSRHEADYNTRLRFTRQEASDYVDAVALAFAAWGRVRASKEAKIFLISLLLWKQWSR